MALLNALKENYQDFLNSKALKAKDPEAYTRDGWWDPDDEIIERFKNAIDKTESGNQPVPCNTEFELSSPARSIVLCGKYTENMSKLSKKLDDNLFKLPYQLSTIKYDKLREKSLEINGIRIFGNEYYTMLFTTDKSGELSLWNVYEIN